MSAAEFAAACFADSLPAQMDCSRPLSSHGVACVVVHLRREHVVLGGQLVRSVAREHVAAERLGVVDGVVGHVDRKLECRVVEILDRLVVAEQVVGVVALEVFHSGKSLVVVVDERAVRVPQGTGKVEPLLRKGRVLRLRSLDVAFCIVKRAERLVDGLGLLVLGAVSEKSAEQQSGTASDCGTDRPAEKESRPGPGRGPAHCFTSHFLPLSLVSLVVYPRPLQKMRIRQKFLPASSRTCFPVLLRPCGSSR